MKEIVSIPSGRWMLHGVVHAPVEIPARRVGVILLGGGYTKLGSDRMQAADALAQSGFYSLRYDNRGTCDSPGLHELTFADRVADARAAVAFLRRHYELDAVLGWGFCLGAAVALHSAAEAAGPQEELQGLVLCSILAHSSQAKTPPDSPYSTLDLRTAAGNILRHRSRAHRLWQAMRSRENWVKKGPALLRRALRLEPERKRFHAAVDRVPELLARYDGPSLLIFGEEDTYWTDFCERVNPADSLGLARKKFPPAWAIIKGSDHDFSSREQTGELIRFTLDWMQPFLYGLLPRPAPAPSLQPRSDLICEAAQ